MHRLLLLFILCLPAAPACARPNLVMIFIDDMGYGDIGPFGSTRNRTPHLDRMAKEGMKLTSFYAAPVCSASRAQLLTGCYAPRVSVPGVFFPAGRNGLHPDEHTVADYLNAQGYATTCIGKWHLGDQRAFLPTRQGFDHYFGIPYSNDMARPALDGRRVHPLMRDEEPAELIEDEQQRRITRAYTEEAVKFIDANKDQPFFLYLPHTAMHVPLYPHPDFAGKSNNGAYGDWVEEVDWSVGEVLKAIEQRGLARNTLVLFTSDNGPWASKGKAGGESGPLRGSKGGTLEGGVREPTIAWWPGRIAPGSVSDAVCGTIDVLPTFVALAGGNLKADRKIDGRNIAGILTGKTTESPHPAWFYYRGTQLKAVRSGPWKLALSGQSLGMGMRQKPADLQKAMRLYNLDQEIGELTDLAAQHPDVVARLKKLAEGMIADIGSGKPGPGVRPAGTVEHPVTLYPTRGRAPKPKPKQPNAGKPLDWNTLKPGDTVIAAQAPPVAGKAFEIACTVDGTPPDGTPPDGIIVAHGGLAVGYALYGKQGKIVFAVRQGTASLTRLDLPVSGKAVIRAGVNGKGKMWLGAGDTRIESPAAVGFLKGHPAEDFCIGHDNGNPIDDQAPMKPFAGRLSGLKMTY